MKTVIAIDPGASGGIAIRSPYGETFAMPMPETRGDVIACLKHHVGGNPKDCVAYHEKINGYIPDGGPSMMFQFGANCERVGCILETLGVRIVEITPQKWQKDFGFGKKGFQKSAPKATAAEKKAVKTANAEAKRDWKLKLKAEAQRRFPGASVTLKTADALLILDFAMRQESTPKTGDLFS